MSLYVTSDEYGGGILCILELPAGDPLLLEIEDGDFRIRHRYEDTEDAVTSLAIELNCLRLLEPALKTRICEAMHERRARLEDEQSSGASFDCEYVEDVAFELRMLDEVRYVLGS